jgi:[ribosomal protein S5]-alanine N-acetyltransferase
LPLAPAQPIDFPVEGISDGVVRLRLMSKADVPAVVEGCQDPEIQRYTTVPSPYRESDALQWLSESEARRREGLALATIVVDADGGAVLGAIDVRREGGDAGRWSIGYATYPHARGRGVATRALRMLARFGFEHVGARRIEVCVEVANRASQRVAEHAGFRREGLLRSYQVIGGQRRDMLMYSLVPGDLGR